MDEERKARLKKMVATKRLKLAMEMDKKKRSKTGEDGSYHTTQIGLGDRERKKEEQKMDWI